METVFSLKSSIWFWLGNENRRIHLGPFLDRDSDDDNDDNDDDSDDSDENFEEWMNNSGNGAFWSKWRWNQFWNCLIFVCTGSDDEEINIFNIDAEGQGNNDPDESAQWTTTDDEEGMD